MMLMSKMSVHLNLQHFNTSNNIPQNLQVFHQFKGVKTIMWKTLPKFSFLYILEKKVEQVRDGCVVVVLVTAPADVTTARTDAHNFCFFPNLNMYRMKQMSPFLDFMAVQGKILDKDEKKTNDQRVDNVLMVAVSSNYFKGCSLICSETFFPRKPVIRI